MKKTKAEGERLQEAQSINSSLLELGNVIQALAEGTRRHIPYRNSTLTRLLQDGLDGNSKTSLIICVSPSFRDVNETLCSLKFGLRAMKVHNVAQVNVEIDYEKMAKQLSETLEGKEREWRRQKSEYESYIMALEAERDARSRHEATGQINSEAHDPTDKVHFQVTLEDESLKNQTKAVLLAELVSMELFYGLEDLLTIGSTGIAQGFTSSKLYSLTDKDLLLHSAETLLELTEYFFAKSTLSDEDFGKNTALKKLEAQDKTLERPSRFLAQGHGTLHSSPSAESSYERKLFRVKETLSRLKRTTDSAALGFLSHLLDTKLDEKEKGLQEYKKRLYDLLKHLVQSQETSQQTSADGDRIDPLKLEQSLCHVLMDKALLNCLLLLDKADMESRMKTLTVHQTQFDYSGLNSMTPIQFDCSSQSSDDFVPSPPLPGTGRLTSVDEGVVLESSSDSANSREKLAAHLENTMEELEAENKRMHEKNEELRKRYVQAEEEKSELTLKILECERKLERSEKKLNSYTQLGTADVIDLQDKVDEKEFETYELITRVEELKDELQAKEQAISLIKENERKLRGQLSEERKHADDAEEQNAKLQLKIRQLEDKFEQSELKLASYTGSELLESSKITKQLESLITENKALSLKIFQLEGRLTENESDNLEFSEDQKKNLERKIIDLEVKLKEQQVKILSVKEYERRLRAELCKEMTKKLTKAQTRSRELGEKIFELESKLREAEQQYTTVRGLDMNTRSAMLDDIKALTDKLQDAESRNKELSLNVQDAEERFRVSQREVLVAKQSEIDLREKAQMLELENCRIQEKLRSRSEEKSNRSATGRTADRLEKLRKENSNLSLELKSFRENILKLERDLLRKDQEILNLRNESVDLSSEVCKLRSELDESAKNNADQKRSAEAQEKLAVKLASLEEELEELREIKTQKNVRVPEVADRRSDSTGSTLLIGEVNFEHALHSESAESFSEKTGKGESIEDSQVNTKQLLSEQKQLQIVIGELQKENSRMSKKNETLLQELKTLESNLSIVENAFRVCRSENECLQQEVNLKSAEATTVRTYASFCSEKAKEFQSEIADHRKNEASLEKRLTDLEKESVYMRNEMGHGILEFSELKEKKESLEKKIVDASRVVDHLKQEILGLVNGMLTLQRDLSAHVDKMLVCLGLDEQIVEGFRLRLPSVDSNDTSTQAEESSSEVSSDVSEVFSWKSPFSSRLFPDKECFLNPSDVSVMRENKTEIIRVHEDLKAKVLAIKDALSRETDVPNSGEVDNGKLDVEHSGELKSQIGTKILTDGSSTSTVLPRLSKAERVKLSSLLSRLKEELIRERKTNNDGRSSGDGNDLCLLYDNLESKLSRLSCELATKEDEITQLLSEKTQLQNELEECERGIAICRHCTTKVPDELEENRNQLKGRLLSHIQDTSRLEGEICEFMEYRQRLEGELDQIKGQITNLEDELVVRNILIERCIGSRPAVDERDVSNSDSSKDETDDFRPSLPGKKRKSQKRVTFGIVDCGESDDKLSNKRRRQKSDMLNGQESEEPSLTPEGWRESDMNASDIDLCELLASIPRDLPKTPPTPEEVEISDIANRLSGYDNMSFDDKLQYATIKKKSEAESEGCDDVQKVLFNGVDLHSKSSVNYDDDGQVTCQMCGLFKKRT